MLEHTYDVVDYISAHAYYQDEHGDLARSSRRRWTWTASSTRSSRPPTTSRPPRQRKKINISFDEWNVWYSRDHNSDESGIENWPVAPRLLEDVYSVLTRWWWGL